MLARSTKKFGSANVRQEAYELTDTGTRIVDVVGDASLDVVLDTGGKLYAFPGGELLQTFGPAPDYTSNLSEFAHTGPPGTWSDPAAEDGQAAVDTPADGLSIDKAAFSQALTDWVDKICAGTEPLEALKPEELARLTPFDRL